MQKLLLLEDDISLIDGLTYSLQKNGFDLRVAGTIREAESLLTENADFDLLLFDVTLPDGNGFTLCEKLRESGDPVPIIFLTASDEETSVIRGLDCGGDDYITKPFKLGELCSRIRVLLRRSSMQSAGEGVLRSGEVTVNLAEGRVFLRGESVEFTGAEYRLLCLFLYRGVRGNHLTLRRSRFDFDICVIIAKPKRGNAGFVKLQIAAAHRNVIVGVIDRSNDIRVR